MSTSATAPRRTSARLAKRAAAAAAAVAASSHVDVHDVVSVHDDDDDDVGSTPYAMSDDMSPARQQETEVLDIDSVDRADCLTSAAFAAGIHGVQLCRETLFMTKADYMDGQTDITTKMRSILIDWLVDVHQKFRLRPETLYLTVNIIDRFLSVVTVNRRKLQLVGVTAMFIASKYEEIYAPEVSDFVYISDKAYTKAEVISMEAAILNELAFEVTLPYSLTFLRRSLKAADAMFGRSEWHAHLAHYLIELALPDNTMLNFRPSTIAAAAVLLSGRLTRVGFVWDAHMSYHCGQSSEEDLSKCENQLRRLLAHEVDDIGANKLTAVKRKFATAKFAGVAGAVFLNGEELTVVVPNCEERRGNGDSHGHAYVHEDMVEEGSDGIGGHTTDMGGDDASQMEICGPSE